MFCMFLIKVCDALEENGVNYAIAGGYAVALHGAVRGTIDIDLVIPLEVEQYAKTEKALLGLGLVARHGLSSEEVFDQRVSLMKDKNLVAWSFYNVKRPVEIVDIIITHDLLKFTSEQVRIGRKMVNMLDIPSLIEMKSKSGRVQDNLDIEALEKLK